MYILACEVVLNRIIKMFNIDRNKSNDFVFQGSVIPTSPPVPEQILRALAYIASKNYPSQK